MEQQVSDDGKDELHQAKEDRKDEEFFHQRFQDCICRSNDRKKSQLNECFDQVCCINDEKEDMIINTRCGKRPVIKEGLCFFILRWIVDESVPSVHFVDYCDVYHAHDHNPEVKYVLKQHELGYSLVLCSEDGLINVLECEHPGAVHHIRDEHCLVFKSIDVVNPLVIIMLDHHLLSLSK